jgi:hypothetical protein
VLRCTWVLAGSSVAVLHLSILAERKCTDQSSALHTCQYLTRQICCPQHGACAIFGVAGMSDQGAQAGHAWGSLVQRILILKICYYLHSTLLHILPLLATSLSEHIQIPRLELLWRVSVARYDLCIEALVRFLQSTAAAITQPLYRQQRKRGDITAGGSSSVLAQDRLGRCEKPVCLTTCGVTSASIGLVLHGIMPHAFSEH